LGFLLTFLVKREKKTAFLRHSIAMSDFRVVFERMPAITNVCGCNGWSTDRYIVTFSNGSQVVARVLGNTTRKTAHLLRDLEGFRDKILAEMGKEFILTESDGTVTLREAPA
jgi:hypothetical protein